MQPRIVLLAILLLCLGVILVGKYYSEEQNQPDPNIPVIQPKPFEDAKPAPKPITLSSLPPVWGKQEQQQQQAAIKKLLWQHEFDQLEQMAEAFRTKKTKDARGFWQLSLFYDALSTPEQTEDEPWSASSLLIPEWNRLVAALELWSIRKPTSITPLLALANAHIDFAWFCRSAKVANEVTPDAWKAFGDGLAKAWKILEKSIQLSTNDPELFRCMLVIGMGCGWEPEQQEEIFQKAMALDPYYIHTYLAKANYSLPRWGGSPAACMQLAQKAAATTRSQEGEAFYARIAFFILQKELDLASWQTVVKQYPFSWELIKQGFVALEAKASTYENLNKFCWLACQYHDRTTAKIIFARLEDNWDQGVWKQKRTFDYWKKRMSS